MTALALRPPHRLEYGGGIEVVAPAGDFPVAQREDGDELVEVRVAGNDGVPVRGLREHRDPLSHVVVDGQDLQPLVAYGQRWERVPGGSQPEVNQPRR